MIHRYIDTSFLIALYQAKDEYHAQARALAATPAQLLTSQWVLVEFAAAFSGVSDRARACEIITELENYQERLVVPASNEWFRRGLDLHRSRADKEWSLTDCISFEIMREFDVREALTADHHFEQAGFVALLK